MGVLFARHSFPQTTALRRVQNQCLREEAVTFQYPFLRRQPQASSLPL